MTRTAPPESYRSPLEKYPKYVRAIGMISIENASLESILGEMLGALLGIHPQIGHTLFFTPKAAIARLDLLENVVELSIAKDATLSKKVRAIIKRSKAAIGKRHEVIHSLWAINELPGPPVARMSFPKWGGADVELQELTDLVRDYRILIEEAGPLIDEVQRVRGFGYKSLHELRVDSL